MTDESERFMWWMALGILIALLFTLSFTAGQYVQTDPAKECRPNIYPICFRASEPAPLAPASPVAVFFSIAGTAVLALILIYAAHHASVTKQANLIVATAEIKTTSSPSAATSPAPAASPASPSNPPSTGLVTQPKESKDLLVPKKKPSKGVDVGLVS